MIEADDRGDSYRTFYQSEMICHCCGAPPVIIEFPRGCVRPEDFDQLLDIGLCKLAEMFVLAVAKRFMPGWPQEMKG